jgi:G6PDH family F420-dependent oxidoreductase
MDFGYFLSSEEHAPKELIEQAVRAEGAGLDHLLISDHFHPWIDRQGHAAFVWSVIGAISARTKQTITTGVTAPTMRIHPVVMAHATATSAVLCDGRFRFGVGSGENLNEHVIATDWPETDVRLEMLEEAVGLIRELWTGEQVSHRGRHYTVRNARLYDVPDTPPPVIVSGFGRKSTELAGRIGDGYITTHPDPEMLDVFEKNGGAGKPKVAGMKVCFGADKDACERLVHEIWPTSGLPGELAQELPSPAHFEQAAQLVTREQAAEGTPCGNDPEPFVNGIKEYEAAGFDLLYLQQIGPDQAGFLEFFNMKVHPEL